MYKVVVSLPRILKVQMQGREYRFLKLASPSSLDMSDSNETLHIETKHKLWVFIGWIRIALLIHGHYLNELFI